MTPGGVGQIGINRVGVEVADVYNAPGKRSWKLQITLEHVGDLGLSWCKASIS